MSVTLPQITLTRKQKEVLDDLGISSIPIYLIRGEQLNDFAIALDGYTSGHYTFFIEGTFQQHTAFLKYLYGNAYSNSLVSRFRGLTIYGAPTQKYLIQENKITITTELEEPPTFQY